MFQVKRYLTNSESSEEKTKKLRITFDERKTISCFESLPNEIYYDIFDYLEGCQLYDAFSNLNIRFQNLLTYSSLPMKIKLVSYPKEILQYRYTTIATPNRHKIISLELVDFWDNHLSFPLFTIDSSFSRLESLVLNSINSNELIPLLVGLTSLPCLFSLTIYADDELEEISNVYRIIFNLSMLKYNKIAFYSYESFIPLPIATYGQFSTIEYLAINHCCTLDELIAIISYTPRLCRLSCVRVKESNENIAKESLNMIFNLTHISIDRCFAEFDELEMFITKISPQLQVLRVNSFRDAAYLDADRWERIISQHLLHLRIFEFKYEETIDEDLVTTLYHEQINRFNSSFWMKRKWLCRIYIGTDFWMDDIIVYYIFPYRKSQVKFHEDKENDETFINVSKYKFTVSSLILSEMNQLTVTDHAYTGMDESFIDTIGPILAMVYINCLNITCREIFIGTLIDLIKYLPNLHSLVVSSLAMIHPRCLSVEEARTLRLVSNNNKITKVNLQRMNDLAQVQFLFDLCPRIEYLEVNCINDVFPEKFVRFILMKNTKYIPNLSSLCLEISLTNEDIVEKLKKMIDLEQLRQNYTIKQIDNRIYLRWN